MTKKKCECENNCENETEEKNVMMRLDLLDDYIKDLIITHGAISALITIFDEPEDDYWSQTGTMSVIEASLKQEKERLFASIESICDLAGRPVFPKQPYRGLMT